MVLAIPALGQAQSAAPGKPADLGSVVLKPGDALRITVFRNSDLSGEFVVGLDGSLRHPLYRSVPVAGIPMPTVEAQLRAFIRRFVTADSLFVVEPLLRVVVGGDVTRPNVYSIGPETSVSQAVALAGGPTERGRRDRILLARDGRTTVVDLRQTGSLARTPIQSGDEIVVERNLNTFRDIIVPTVGVVGALAAIANVFLYNRR
jgi:protein involved in polysaccharide export with SLBB domain